MGPLSVALLGLVAPGLLGCNPDSSPEASATMDAATGETTTGEPPATSSDADPTTTDGAGPTTTAGAGACGDGHLDPGEACDGADLGGKTCADIDPAATGTLACAADCGSLDASGCQTGAGAAVIVMNEIATRSAETGPYADKGDAIELYNAGGAAADLSGWKLSDDATFPIDKTYVFPPGSQLEPGGFLVLVEVDPDTGEGQLPFGLSATDDETVTLVDAGGVKVDETVTDTSKSSGSYCRLPDGAGAWQFCDQTLGAGNLAATQVCGDGAVQGDELCDGGDLAGAACGDLGYDGGDLACMSDCTLDVAMCVSDTKLVLNELEASGDDRIEIFNAGDDAVDVTGWILTDGAAGADYDPGADLEKLVFPGTTTIPAKSYLVVVKGDFPGEHPFGLSMAGDTVTLMKPDLTVINQVSYGADQAAVSYCRIPDGPQGAWTPDCAATLGAGNKMP